MALDAMFLKTSEVCLWISMVVASPSPTVYLTVSICSAIFGGVEGEF